MKFSITTFIIQVINFVLLAYILYRVLYRPLRNIMEKRKRLVMDDIDRAVRLKEDAITIKEKYEKLVKETEALKKRTMERAVEEAEETKRSIIEKAVREAAEEKEKARAVIENERTEMTAALKKGAADISAELASSLLAPLADEALHGKLAEMMLRELEERPPSLPEGRRGSVRVMVITAYALVDKERKGLESVLKEYLGPSVSIEEKVEPELIAGMRLWIDGLVLDGSLKGQLSAFRERAMEALG